MVQTHGIAPSYCVRLPLPKVSLLTAVLSSRVEVELPDTTFMGAGKANVTQAKALSLLRLRRDPQKCVLPAKMCACEGSLGTEALEHHSSCATGSGWRTRSWVSSTVDARVQ